MMELSSDELQRYQRHLSIPGIGLEGQRKLKASRVLVLGAGGLGSPAALYLCAGGIGTIGIVDKDNVEVSNLQRQILHTTTDVGRRKTDSARSTLSGLNPHTSIEVHDLHLTEESAPAIIKNYDVVVDGTDNFDTRFVVNDACVMLKKPLVFGSVYRFEGQVAVFDSTRGPCYRCLHPQPPPQGLVPDCTVGGVLGVLPGIVGSIQAAEAIKLCLGVGEPLIGRMLQVDMREMKFREIALAKNSHCPTCHAEPHIPTNSQQHNNRSHVPSIEKTDEDITVNQLKRRLDEGENILILDVRQPSEFAIANITGVLLPLDQLPARYAELDPSREIITLCHHGFRSAYAAAFLREHGFTRVRNLTGGIDAWSVHIDPTVPRY